MKECNETDTDNLPQHEIREKENAKIWRTIEKDVKRTRVELAFFREAVNPKDCTSMEDMDRLER